MNNLIQLPVYLGVKVSEILKEKGIEPRTNSSGILSLQFTKEELGLVTDIAIDNETLQYMAYFPNVKSATFNSNIDISPFHIQHFINTHPNLESLEISNKSDLRDLDLSKLSKLHSLRLHSNPSLERIIGLSEMTEISRIDCYNNSRFESNEEICRKMVEIAYATGQCTADAMYFSKVMEIINQNEEFIKDYNIIAQNFNWREQLTTNFHVDHYTGEMKRFYDKAQEIVQSYIKPTDTPEQKYAIIYQWLCENVEYNHDAANNPTHTSVNDGIVQGRKFGTNGMTNGLLYGSCVCQGYVHTAKFLLDLCGVKSTDVLCAAARANRERLSSTSDISLKESDTDHSILKIDLGNGNVFYSDITIDSESYKKNEERNYFLLSHKDMSKDHRLFNQFETVSTSKSYSNEERDALLTFASERIKEVDKQMEAQDFIDKIDDINDIRNKLQTSTERYRQISSEIESLMQRNSISPIPNFEEQLQNLIGQRDKENVNLEKYRNAEVKASELAHQGMLNNITRATGVIISPVKSYEVDAETGIPIEVPKDKVELAHELGEMRDKLDEAMQNGIIDMQTCLDYKRFLDNEYHDMQKNAPYHQKEQQTQFSPQTQDLINQAQEVINQPTQQQEKDTVIEWVEEPLQEALNPIRNIEQQVPTNPFDWTDEELEADFDFQNITPNFTDTKPKTPLENDVDVVNYFVESDLVRQMQEARRMVDGIPLHPEQVEHSHGRIM